MIENNAMRVSKPCLLVTLSLASLASVAVAAAARPARAADPVVPAASTSVAAAAPAPPPPAPPPPPPYSLPWQLRPVAAATVVRSDTSVAFYENAMGQTGSTIATMLLASYKLTPSLAPLVRLGFVNNGTPGSATPDGSSFVNPIVGLTYARKLGSFRLAGFLAGTVPIGAGGGNTPAAGAATANAAGRDARSGMDNAMFAVNYFTAIGGAGAAYVDHKLTVQAEVTVLQLFRVRGENAGSSTDSTRTNSTAGLHVGYFLAAPLSIGAELRYQRFLTTPTRIVMMNKVDFTDAQKDTLSVAIGPRAHFALGKGTFLRPGISYARVLDKPLADSSYNVIQVDIPVVF